MIAPEWLTNRDGSLKPGPNAQTWLLTLGGHPMHRLFATTAQGQFACVVTQSNNGQRFESGKLYPTTEAALAGGLEELRTTLGW